MGFSVRTFAGVFFALPRENFSVRSFAGFFSCAILRDFCCAFFCGAPPVNYLARDPSADISAVVFLVRSFAGASFVCSFE